MTWLLVAALAYFQNVSYSMISRARNRDSMAYHAVAAVFANGVWFLTMRELVAAELTVTLMLPYVVGTVAGSLTGAKVSMFIERRLGAVTDSHIRGIGNDQEKGKA